MCRLVRSASPSLRWPPPQPSLAHAHVPRPTRQLVYMGQDPILLSHLLTRPAHSIINQAFASRLRLDLTRGPINGDGFGVGWYDTLDGSSASSQQQQEREGEMDSASLEDEHDLEGQRRPCIFNSTGPAWNNANLQRLAEKIRSPLVFAHVRASTSGALSEQNCHPWSFDRLMWMHNGGIASFSKIKRRLQAFLPEELYQYPQGSTDSEWAFALFLSFLPRHLLYPSASSTSVPSSSSSRPPLSMSESTATLRGEAAPSSVPAGGGGKAGGSVFGPRIMQKAMLKTISKINEWTKEVGAEEPSLLNFCVTDGESVVVTRYVSSRTQEAASLFFSSGSSFTESPPNSSLYRMTPSPMRPDRLILVCSEPLTFARSDWLEVPTNTLVVITPNHNVLQVPIVDEFRTEGRDGPARDVGFAVRKGFGEGLLIREGVAVGAGGGGGKPSGEDGPGRRSRMVSQESASSSSPTLMDVQVA